MYFNIPQHSWGLVSLPNEQVNGFYSDQGGPCRPVTFFCKETNQASFAHWDNPNLVTTNLIEWLTSNEKTNEILVLTPQDNMAEVVEAINNTVADQKVSQQEIDIDQWGIEFFVLPDGQFIATPVDPNDLPEDQLQPAPPEWSMYWEDAPDWQGGSTFNAQIILSLTGFFSNFNGRYFLDFGEPDN